jgi:hypothetical protein
MQPKTKRKGNTMSDPTTSKIAELNDLCRKAMGVAGADSDEASHRFRSKPATYSD